MQNHLQHTCGPTWCSGKEVIDALGHGFAALCREKLLLFGDKHHHLGHLVQRRLSVGEPAGQESIPCTELHVVILQRQEWHQEIDEVLSEEVAVGITVLWSKTQDKANSEASPESVIHPSVRPGLAPKGSSSRMWWDPLVQSCSALSLSLEHLSESHQETPGAPEKLQYCPVVLSFLLPPAIFRAEGGEKASRLPPQVPWLAGTKDGALIVNSPGLVPPHRAPCVHSTGTAPAHSPPEQAQLLPAASCSSSCSRCSRSSMGISSRARPARQNSRATSLMVLPPRLLWTQGKSLKISPRAELLRAASSFPADRSQQSC